MYEQAVVDARAAAERFLDDRFVFRREHIEIERWAREEEIDIYEGALDGAQAQLIRTRDRRRIILSDRIADHGARRFNLMHELAHLLLKHMSASLSLMCTPSKAREQRRGAKVNEVSANTFTSAVLVPARQVSSRCNPREVNLDVPWALSKEYDVSILTSAIRVTELSPQRCAAVFSKNGKVVWCAESDTFRHKIRRGTRLRAEALASCFFEDRRLDESARRLPARAWVDGDNAEIVEHSTPSIEHGTVLSMLWLPN